MSKEKQTRHVSTHEEIIALTIKLAPQKEALQKRFDGGLRGTVFAKELGVAASTMGKVLDGLGLKWSIRDPDRKRSSITNELERLSGCAERAAHVAAVHAMSIQKLRTVLIRLCKNLNFDETLEINEAYFPVDPTKQK